MGTILFWLLLLNMFVGLTPFWSDPDPQLGSTINKSFWVLVGALASVTIFRTWKTSRVLALKFWPVGVPMAWFGLSILWSEFPILTLERFGILGIMAASAFAVAASGVPKKRLVRSLLVVSGATLVVNVGSVFLVSDIALFAAGGKFRGMFSNPNTTGTVTALTFLAFSLAVLASRTLAQKVAMALVAGLAFWFLLGTESATSVGAAVMAPLPIAALLFGRRFSLVGRILAVSVGAVALLAGMIWLVAAGVGAEDIAQVTFGDTTFTGRTFLWAALVDEIRGHPWAGSAYGAFWYLDASANALYATTGFLAGAGQAHNGYLDLVLQGGVIGFLAAMVPVFHMGALGLRYSYRMRGSTSRKWLSLFPLGLFVFMIVHNLMESSLFRSGSTLALTFFLGYFLLGSWDMLDKTGAKRRRSRKRGRAKTSTQHRGGPDRVRRRRRRREPVLGQAQ